jgi:hypothetical protein
MPIGISGRIIADIVGPEKAGDRKRKRLGNASI